VPRIAQSFTSERSVQSAFFTASGPSPSTRAHSVSSAEDMTWAWRPQSSEATFSIRRLGTRASRW
jgi:hypothetical protein